MSLELLWTSLYWLWAGSATSWLGLQLIRAWQHQDDWYNRCRTVEAWQEHFEQNVAHGWRFFDGVGA